MLEPGQRGEVLDTGFVEDKEHVLDERAELGRHLKLVILVKVVFLGGKEVLAYWDAFENGLLHFIGFVLFKDCP